MDDFLGNKGKSSASTGKDPTPDPSPFSKNENGEGSSIAVLQFVALARGEWGVQKVRSPFRVESVTAEERYCLRCCGVRWFDVVRGTPLPPHAFGAVTSPQMRESAKFGGKVLAICRCCGAEGWR